jgi:hypothetical protein
MIDCCFFFHATAGSKSSNVLDTVIYLNLRPNWNSPIYVEFGYRTNEEFQFDFKFGRIAVLLLNIN